MNGWNKFLLATIVVVTLQISYGATVALAATTRGPTPQCMGIGNTAMDNNGPALLTTAWNANVGDESMNLLTSSGPPVFPDGDAQVNSELNDEYAARLCCATSIATCGESAAAAMMSTSPPGTSSLCPSTSCVAIYITETANSIGHARINYNECDEQSTRPVNSRGDPVNLCGSPTKFQQVDATQHQLAKL